MSFTYLFLALSLSIDSIGIGITYGLRNTYIPLLSKLILFLISVIFTTIALLLGNLITYILPDNIANYIGSFILVFIGFWILFQIFHSSKNDNVNLENINKDKIYTLFIKFLGITIQIIKHPNSSDFDNSKIIDFREAFFLGIALSIDSISVSIGSGITGMNSFLFPLLVATFHIAFLFLGSFLGKKISGINLIPDYICNVISGVLLVLIGVSRLFI